MANTDNLKPFVKGDPRINRNGRPKSFDALRKLAQQLSSEVATDANGQEVIRDGHKVTIAEMVLLQMVRDKKQRKEFLEIAFGKVPVELNFDGNTTQKVIIEYADSDNTPDPA